MGVEDQSYSFFPFGALFCLTLFCFVAVRIFSIRSRYKDSNQLTHLKKLVSKGEMTEAEYQRFKELLTK